MDSSGVFEAITRLPEEYSVVLNMRHLEGLSLKEIAKVLNISLSGVNTRLYRARKMLRESLRGG